MGFFSWLTADTHKSITNIYSTKKTRPVYLLRINGKSPICEENYEGYGVFGGIDAYSWLAINNIPVGIIINSGLKSRSLGISLDCGRYYTDEDGNYYVTKPSEGLLVKTFLKKVSHLSENYDAILTVEGVTSTFSEHVESNRLYKHGFKEFIKYPLKFSFNKKAVYSRLLESSHCPNQGFF